MSTDSPIKDQPQPKGEDQPQPKGKNEPPQAGDKLKEVFGYKEKKLRDSTESPITDNESDSGSKPEGDKSSREQVIEWNLPQSSFDYGTPLSDAYLKATVVKGNGKLTYSVKKNDVLKVGKQTLRVDAAATPEFDAAFKTVEVEVKPKITWKAPGTSITYGEKLSSAQLNATVTPKGVTLVYTPALDTVLNAGIGQVLRVTAQVGENLNAATKEVRIDVNKAPAVITWPEPRPVMMNTLLSDTQLNATSNSTAALVYKPAKNTNLSVAKTYWLMVTQEATSNHLSAVRQVRLMVGESQNALTGFNGVDNGSKWFKGNMTPQAQQVLNKWNAATGNMKTQGQKIMKDLSGKTSEELIEYMDKLVPATGDRTSKGGTYPNKLWKLPNGLQVRYKSNGDKRNVGVPMFCIEGRTTAGFSSSQSDIAFKVSSSGVATAKGSKDTQRSNLSSTEDEKYLNGACKATHLYCEPKTDPVIEWTPPTEMEVTAKYTTTQLCAELKFGDNSLTYAPKMGEKPKSVQADLKLKVTAGKTKRFNAASLEVSINVVKTRATINWGPLEDITYGESLGPKQFNATARGEAKIKYKPGGGKLKVGDNQPIKAFIEEDREFEAVEKIQTINVKKADPEITWKDQTIVYGAPLSKTELSASQRGDGELTYDPPIDTKLEVGDGQVLTVRSTETANYKASTKKVTINVVPANPKLNVRMPKTSIPYGTLLSQVEIVVTQVGDGALTYNHPLDKPLNVGNYTLKVTSAKTEKYKTDTAEFKFKIVQADHVINWPTPGPIVYGTKLSTDQLNATSTTCDALVYDPPLGKELNAGLNQILKVTAKGDKNYKGKSVTVNIDVKQAKYKIEWTPAPIDVGQPLGDKQLNAKCTPDQSLEYSLDAGHVFLTAGSQPLQVTAAEKGNYEETTQDVQLTVNPATPTIEWNPGELTYGTPLSSEQLNATSNSDGKATYSPPLSSILPAGPGQTLRVTFAATENYLSATKEVKIDVKPAKTVIKWWEPEDQLSITYGTLLSDVQLNATKEGILASTGILSDPGELKYTPGLGTKLIAGLGQTLRVESPATANFEAAIKEIEIDVFPIVPVIDWDDPPEDMKEGDPLTADQLNAKCEGGGALVYSPPLGTKLPIGDGQSLQVSVEATANTLPATKTVKVNVKPAT